jgi:trigger factor
LETRESLAEFQRYLESMKMTYERYFEVTGQTPDQLIEMMQGDARRAVKLDLALRSIAAEEGLEPTQEQLDEELEKLAKSSGRTPDKLRDELERSGRGGAIRAQKIKEMAADWVLERVTFVDEAGAEIDRSYLEADEDEATTESDGPEGPGTDTTEESE